MEETTSDDYLTEVTSGEDQDDLEEDSDAECEFVIHKVTKLDTLAGIALAHDVSVCVLKTVNQLMSDSIYANQLLKIPLKSTTAPTASPKAGSDPCLMARAAAAGHELIGHVVKKTDTISSVALRYSMRTSELKEINNLCSNHLKVGSVLKVFKKPPPPSASDGDLHKPRRKSLSSSAERGKRKSRVSSTPTEDDPQWSFTPDTVDDTRRNSRQNERTRAKSTISPRPLSISSPAKGKQPTSPSRTGEAKTKKGFLSVFSTGGKKSQTSQQAQRPASTSKRATKAMRLQSLRIGTVPHVACPGETIESIADVYSMRVSDLRELNELVTDQLYPGQLVYVKTGNVPSQSPYQPRRKRSLSTSVAADAAGVGRRREEGFSEYTVSATDTLSGIALAHNMTVARLKAVNNMSASGKIYKGLKLLVDPIRPSMCSPPRSSFVPSNKETKPPQKDTPRTALNRSLRSRSLRESFLSVPADMRIPEDLIHSFPCRFLVKNSPQGIKGTCTMTPHRVIFEPDTNDEFVVKNGSMAAQLELEIGEVTAPLLLTKSELATIIAGTSIEPSNKGASILQVSRLADANDDLSDIAATYNLLVENGRGENSYKTLLDYLCNYSMLLAQERARLAHEAATAALVVPKLHNQSTIFDEDQALAKIASYLPHRLQQCSWALAFASDKHGISLSTFYQRLCTEQNSLLFVEDNNGHVFGGFASAPWEVQEGYFGSGESFVFQYRPNASVYTWNAEHSNAHFLLAHKSHIEFGGGSRPSLWIGEDFYEGATGTSETYMNPPLSCQEDFKCTAVEVWVMRPPM